MHSRYLILQVIYFDVDETGAAHLDALLANHLDCAVGASRWSNPVLHQVATERSACPAGSRVLRDTKGGREHPAVDERASILDLPRERKHIGRNEAAQHAVPGVLAQPYVSDGVKAF